MALKVLHIFDHSLPLHSGYTFRSLALLDAQRRLGWEIAAMTTPRHEAPGPAVETIGDYRFHRTPLPTRLARLPALGELAMVAATARRIRAVAAIEKPDLLHAHSPVLNPLAALWASRQLKLPVLYEVRAFWEDAAVGNGEGVEGSPRYRATHFLDSAVFRRCAGVTTICEGLRQDIARRGIPADKITVIPNGVDLDQFQCRRTPDAALRATLGLAGKTVLGFLGSFYPYEGLDLLINAMAGLRATRDDLAVLLAGGGPAEPALRAEVARHGLEDAVRFVGRIPHTQVQDYYDLVDIFVYPRRAMRLTELVTPLKPLEAMARGGIVLASDVGGHRELLRDGETAYLFRADDPQALVHGIVTAMDEKARWPAMGAAGRRFVERERSWTRSAQGYLGAYGKALGRPLGGESAVPDWAPQALREIA